MYWIIGVNRDLEKIMGGAEAMMARHRYIEEVSHANVTPWGPLLYDGRLQPFIFCESDEGIEGIYYIGHIDGFWKLYREWKNIEKMNYIICNACKMGIFTVQMVANDIRKINPKCRFFYAKQKYEMRGVMNLVGINLIQYVGNFGFYTSLSERLLYKNRELDFIKAIEKNFCEQDNYIYIGEKQNGKIC